jgi:hypothetical protein
MATNGWEMRSEKEGKKEISKYRGQEQERSKKTMDGNEGGTYRKMKTDESSVLWYGYQNPYNMYFLQSIVFFGY